jgi:hypothetical protein
MVQLVPMTEVEFQTFRESDIAEYAQEHVKSGRWRPEEALQLAEQEFTDLLPDGLTTPNHYLFSIEDKALGTKVGRLWFAVRDGDREPIAFVFNVVIFTEGGLATGIYHRMGCLRLLPVGARKKGERHHAVSRTTRY